ncbi:MAG: hypothetical protein HQL21_06415 [Candidatus Omnitrophica bacterium]|nr:hypothetical protein [Candidatus Omnitrophota bacterium]
MNDYLSVMLSFVKDAGVIALKHIEEGRSDLKPDASVITDADRLISQLAHERLAPYLKSSQHLLIDEEDPRKTDFLDQSLLERTPFLWSVDPIDATRSFANRMPHYGISIGLIKDLRPWLGAVYFPSLKELFYCDGVAAYFIRNAFTSGEIKTEIVPIDEQITSRSVFIATDEILSHFHWEERECRIMIFSAAVCEFCWPTIGRGCGSLSMVHLWDFAGSWPIFEKAGLKLRAFEDGRVLDKIDAGLFHKEASSWRLKDYYILSSETNYCSLRARLRRKHDHL